VIAGLRPDIEAARKWYKAAADLGDSQAATRLSGSRRALMRRPE
jgi:TPR repeat protein